MVFGAAEKGARFMKITAKSLFWNMVLALGVMGLTLPPGAMAGEECVKVRTISLTGGAVLKMMPDQALVSAQINLLDKTAKKARDRADEVVNALFKNLAAVGLTDKDVRADSIYLYEEYAWEKDKRVSKGFRASRSVTVTVNDLTRLSETMDLIMKSGFNNVSGIHYRVRDSKAVKAKVREEAVKDALTKAESIVGGLNARLGKVLTISYGTVDYDNPQTFRAAKSARMEMAGAAANGPGFDSGDRYQAEEISFSDRVDITWELE